MEEKPASSKSLWAIDLVKKKFRAHALIVLMCLILVAIIQPYWVKRQDYALLQECGDNVSTVVRECFDFSAKNDYMVPLHQRQLGIEIRCPVSGRLYQIVPGEEVFEFSVFCTGHHHSTFSDPNYPRGGGTNYPAGVQLAKDPESALNSRFFERWLDKIH